MARVYPRRSQAGSKSAARLVAQPHWVAGLLLASPESRLFVLRSRCRLFRSDWSRSGGFRRRGRRRPCLFLLVEKGEGSTITQLPVSVQEENARESEQNQAHE